MTQRFLDVWFNVQNYLVFSWSLLLIYMYVCLPKSAKRGLLKVPIRILTSLRECILMTFSGISSNWFKVMQKVDIIFSSVTRHFTLKICSYLPSTLLNVHCFLRWTILDLKLKLYMPALFCYVSQSWVWWHMIGNILYVTLYLIW